MFEIKIYSGANFITFDGLFASVKPLLAYRAHLAYSTARCLSESEGSDALKATPQRSAAAPVLRAVQN